MKEECEKVKDRLAAFVDEQLDLVEVDSIVTHLETCPECAANVEAQRTIKNILHRRARPHPAPPALRARIRRSLSAYPAEFGFWPLVKRLFEFQPRPAFAAIAAVILLSVSLTYLGTTSISRFSNPASFQANSHLTGELVCADCLVLRATHTQSHHDTFHRIALRTGDGRVWTIVHTEKYEELRQGMRNAPQQIEIEGYVFPQMRFIQVTDFKLI